MAQEEADQVGEIDELEDVPQYPKFKFVSGFLSRNERICEGVNLALKVFHHDPTGLAIYRPLAQMDYPEIENEVILHALNMIRNKGCIFNLFAPNEFLVSLKAVFPLENPAARVPIVGFYMRYTATLGVVEDGKHSQKLFFFVKVLRELAHLMIYYFNKAKNQSTGTGIGSSIESNDLITTPTTIGAIVIKGQIKGDPGKLPSKNFYLMAELFLIPIRSLLTVLLQHHYKCMFVVILLFQLLRTLSITMKSNNLIRERSWKRFLN
jgi:hypothetical protein